MQNVVYEEITSLFHQACQDLKPEQMLHSDDFNLHDSMSAIELYDLKMDYKASLKDEFTLEYALQNKTIKHPSELTIQELVGLLDELMGKEMLWLSGQSLPHTVYTFYYLYDAKIYEENKFLRPYIHALNTEGAIVQEIIRYSAYLREEDYIPSTIGFVTGKGHEEISQDLIAAERELEDQLSQKKKKKKKQTTQQEEQKVNLNEYDALYARLRLRRGLLSLFVSMKSKFTAKLREHISTTIGSCLKTLETVRETLEHSENCEKYFSEKINKTLLCHIPPRQVNTISKQDAINEVEKMLKGLQAGLDLSQLRDLYDIQKALQSYSLIPKNIIARAYIDINIFQNNSYFGLISTKELALTALEDFVVKQGRELVTNEKVVKFVENSCAILEEILCNNLRNRTKQRREVCKIYYSLNIFAHDAYTLDEIIHGKSDDKIHMLFIWVLDIALKLMTRQLFQGFELGLYNDEEYCIIFFLLDHIFSFLDRNFRSVITKYDKEFLMAWQSKQNLDKKKKRLTDFQRKFFYESLYYKAIENYVKVMLRLSYVIIHKEIVKIPKDEELLRFRYYQRLRVFDNIYFLRKNEFEDFVQSLKAIEELEFDKLLKDLKGVLEANVKLLNEISSDETYDARIKNDLDKLKRVCVMNSLAMTKLEMHKGSFTELKAVFKNNEHPFFPVLDIQKK